MNGHSTHHLQNGATAEGGSKNAPPPPPNTYKMDPLWKLVPREEAPEGDVAPIETSQSDWAKREIGNSSKLLHNQSYTVNGYHRSLHGLAAQVIAEIIHKEREKHYPDRHDELPPLRKGGGEVGANQSRVNIGEEAIKYILSLASEGLKPWIRRILEMQLHRDRETLTARDVQSSCQYLPGWNVRNIFYPNDYQWKQGARYMQWLKCVEQLRRIRKRKRQSQARRRNHMEEKKKAEKAVRDMAIDALTKAQGGSANNPKASAQAKRLTGKKRSSGSMDGSDAGGEGAAASRSRSRSRSSSVSESRSRSRSPDAPSSAGKKKEARLASSRESTSKTDKTGSGSKATKSGSNNKKKQDTSTSNDKKSAKQTKKPAKEPKQDTKARKNSSSSSNKKEKQNRADSTSSASSARGKASTASGNSRGGSKKKK